MKTSLLFLFISATYLNAFGQAGLKVVNAFEFDLKLYVPDQEKFFVVPEGHVAKIESIHYRYERKLQKATSTVQIHEAFLADKKVISLAVNPTGRIKGGSSINNESISYAMTPWWLPAGKYKYRPPEDYIFSVSISGLLFKIEE